MRPTDAQLAAFDASLAGPAGDRPITAREFFRLVPKAVGTVLRTYFDPNVTHERIAALEAAMAALQERTKGINYVGPFAAGKSYPPGTYCTHKGALWHADRDTTATPGTGGGWTLAVKAHQR